MLEVKIKRLPHGEGLPLPSYGTAGAAGLDLYAAMPEHDTMAIGAHMRIIPTGICVAIPAGCCGLVIPRSGLAAKHQITITNAPGLIDEDYRGEIQVMLENHSPDDYHTIKHGDRIGQLLILPYPKVQLQEVEELPDTPRGEAGFGSTGR